MSLNLLAEYTILDAKIDAAEAALKALKAERDDKNREVLAYFESSGVRSANVNGCCVYLQRKLWARPRAGQDKPSVCAALEQSGVGDLVEPSVNVNKLSAWVRELRTEAEDQAGRALSVEEVLSKLPELVRKVVIVTEDFSIMVRKA